MLIALEEKGSAFTPLLNKPPITWRLRKFKEHHLGRRGSETTLVELAKTALKVPAEAANRLKTPAFGSSGGSGSLGISGLSKSPSLLSSASSGVSTSTRTTRTLDPREAVKY